MKYKTLDNTLLEYVKRAYYPSWNTSIERQRELTSIIQDFYKVNEDFGLIITRKESIRSVNSITLLSRRVLIKSNTNIKQRVS